MSNLKSPLFSLDARNSLGKAISFVKRRGRNIAEKKPEIDDAKSPAQLSWRHMYQKCAALWHTLSAAEQQEWNSLGGIRHMTGFAYWQSQCLRPNPGIYLPLQGGVMSGDIDMAKNRLLKLPAPTDAQEAARKAEVDAVAGEHSLSYFRRTERWHFSFFQNSNASAGIEDGRLWAVPFYAPKAITINAIGCSVTVGAAGLARLGIYNDNGSIYPGSLVHDCGVIDITVLGIKEIWALAVSLSANTLYWLAYLANAQATLRIIDERYQWGLLGSATAGCRYQEGTWRAVQAYGALPDPYPAAATDLVHHRPGIGVYFE